MTQSPFSKRVSAMLLPWRALAGALLLISYTSGQAALPRYEVLRAFDFAYEGAGIVGNLALTGDGQIYAMNNGGSAHGLGSVFGLKLDGTVTFVRPFECCDDAVGYEPRGLTLANNGKFYGVTTSGGIAGFGGIYSMTAAGDVQALIAFRRQGGSPISPQTAPVQGIDGLLYGTSMGGGSVDQGSLYRLALDGSQFEVLNSFDGKGPSGRPGHYPMAALTQTTDGTWYGVTSGGSRPDCGAAFSSTDQGTKAIWVVNGHMERHMCPDYQGFGIGLRETLLLGPDGQFYGTTYQTGQYHLGTVFRLSPEGRLTVLHDFSGIDPDGQLPNSPLVLGPDGAFYGTAKSTVSGSGMIYRITRSGKFSVVFLLPRDKSEGDNPNTLLLGPDGNFYGTARYGGPSGTGVFFRLTP